MAVKKLVSIIAFLLFAIVLLLSYKLYSEKRSYNDLESKYVDISEKYTVTEKTLFGYTTFTSYSAILNKSLSEQMKFIGAKTKRRYMHQENIVKSIANVKSYAAIELVYDAEYVTGYDLSKGKFKLDITNKGITLHLNRPEIVAAPATTYTFTRILSGAMLIDEKQETINLQNKLPQIIGAKERINEIINDEAVVALCEKKIKELIRDILVSQNKAEIIPDIVIAYNS